MGEKLKRLRRGVMAEALHVARLAAMEAGEYALRQFTHAHVLKQKPITWDVVTEIDVECEKRIVRILSKSFPKHTILTEERQLAKQLADWWWWVDPLDGSVSYVFGLPYWGVSLALVYKGEVVVGVVYFPQNRDLFWAIKGRGAWLNYKRLRVAKHSRLSEGVMGIDYGYRGERTKGVRQITMRVVDATQHPVSYACTAGAIALVAQGKLVGYIHHMARRFDVAAGALLVTEAGGKVSDTNGKPIDWSNTKPVHVVCTNGRVHRELLRLLKKRSG